ncbi:uncharacterized protein LOC143548287 [Bidens hawaiensis]|uniref:uncharacterized protein LOC143548287 n=1 Tax=Bidens hawaiensis TaxID=980011 RepID=UPI00404A678B
MEAVMDAQGLWESIEPSEGAMEDVKTNKTARAFIFQTIPKDVLMQVAKKKTAKEIWESLKTRYVGADHVQKARLHTLKGEFEALRMKDGESIDEFTGKLSRMCSKYSSLGETLEDGTMLRKPFDSVPDRFIQLVASVEQTFDVDAMSFEEAIGRLKAYEDQLKLRQGNTSRSWYLVGVRGRGNHNERGGRRGSRGCGYVRGRGGRCGGGTQQETSNNARKPKDKKHVKCFKCEQLGHYASECEEARKPNEAANLIQAHEEEPTLLLTVHGEEMPNMVLLNEKNVIPCQDNEDNKGRRDVWLKDSFSEDERVTGQYMWLYLIKTKDEAFEMFKKFKVQAEKESSYVVKILRTDRGVGIKRQLTAPYTPQQNGVVERRNKTILGMTRSLLKAMKIPEVFWGEAVRHSVYLLNRITTKTVANKTPYEGWKGSKPTLHHLRVFGCVAHVKRLSNQMVAKLIGCTILIKRGLWWHVMLLLMKKRHWAWKEIQDKEPNKRPEWVNVQFNNSTRPEPQLLTSDDENGQSPKTPPSSNHNIFPALVDSAGNHGVQENSISTQSSSTGDSRTQRLSTSFDHTPIQGFRSIKGLYEKTTAMNDEQVRDLYEQELLLVDGEPTSYKEASHDREWKKAMESELDSIEKNKTWCLVKLPSNHKAIGLKWVFKLKRDENGMITKHKARFVAKGYVHKKGHRL